MKYFFLVALALIFENGQAYKAAVVEHYPSTSDSPLNTILTNLESYRSYVSNARDQAVNIIVFPEYGLTTIVEDPEDYAVEFNNDTQVITRLSNIAKEYGMYLVVNLLEKVQEENKKTIYYNTNAVFGRQGRIIAKYRKINLFDEPKLTPGDTIVTFPTDFGVTFGLFTCFDILFHNPSKTILDNDKVTDIIYPTAWYSTLPLYSSLSVQHGYSVANGVNLLAANYGKPKEAHGGSGIYLADGTISEIYIDPSASSKLIVQEIKKIDMRQEPNNCTSIAPQGLPTPDQKPDISDYKTLKDFTSSDYVFRDLDVSSDRIETKLCQGDFCCNFNISISFANTNEHYKLAVFDGKVTSDKVEKTQHVRFCTLLACESDSKDSCGARIKGTTTFRKIFIEGNLPSDNTTFYRPVTLGYSLRPISIKYCNSYNNNKSNVQLATAKKVENDVLVFGIYGKVDTSSAVHNSAVVVLFILAITKSIFL